MLDLTLVVVAKDRKSMDQFKLDHVNPADLVLVVNSEGKPLSSIGNKYLDNSECAVFGLVHADVVFGPGSLEVLLRTAAAGSVCGVVGRNPDISGERGYIWANKNPGPVSTLDSASCFFRRDLGLRFDEKTFDSFHLHVEDLCIQAGQRGIPIVVPAADAYHDAHEVNGRLWLDQYWSYYPRLQAKWPGVRFGTT